MARSRHVADIQRPTVWEPPANPSERVMIYLAAFAIAAIIVALIDAADGSSDIDF